MKNETATSSKAAMEELLGKDGTAGTVKTQLTEITKALNPTDGIQKLVETAAAGVGPTSTLDVKAKFEALTAAVGEANKVIDEKLNSGDLTQLDTSNLKALRSSINDIQSQLESAFADFGIDPSKTNNTIAPAKAKELLAALKAGVVVSDTELGERAGGVATSSQNQAETISEMRDQLQAFAANPKGATGLESANFTGYLETVDAALSNISDQRAKLGASQNRLEYTIKTIMLGVF